MKNNQTKAIIWATLTILWVSFIFSNSLKTSDLSTEDSQLVLEWLSDFLQTTAISMTVVRKCAHVFEYTVLGFLLLQSVKQFGVRLPKLPIVAGVVGVLVASADETIQLFVEGRSGAVVDVLIDSIGIALGLTVGMLWYHRARWLKPRKTTDICS